MKPKIKNKKCVPYLPFWKKSRQESQKFILTEIMMNSLSKNLHICEFAFFILQKQTKQTFLANLIGRKTASKISPCF